MAKKSAPATDELTAQVLAAADSGRSDGEVELTVSTMDVEVRLVGTIDKVIPSIQEIVTQMTGGSRRATGQELADAIRQQRRLKKEAAVR